MPKGDTITTRYKIDISDLKQNITTANQKLKENKSVLNLLNSEMQKNGKSSETMTKAVNTLRNSLEQQKSKLQSYRQQLETASRYETQATSNVNGLRAALENAKAEYGENSTQVKEYQQKLTAAEKELLAMQSQVSKLTITMNNQEAAVNSTESELNDMTNSLDRVRDAEQRAARTGQSLDDALEDIDSSSRTAGDGFTVMKGALASLIADGIRRAISGLKELSTEVVKVGAAFDSSMAQVQAVSGASADEVERLRDKAKEMGATTKFTASEAADAFNYMAMAGWKTEDMMSGIDGILNLAAASGADLATTSDIVTDALTAMGYQAKDSGRLADVMAAASSNANTNVEMMGATFQYAAPIVGALGYTMEDTAVAIGLMANAGIKGEKAGTALRSIFTRLAAPPKECANAMEELGISLTDSEGKMKPFSKIMEDLREKMDGLSETEQAGTAKHIAGQEAMSGLLAIVNAAPADFEKLTKAVDKSAGSAAKMSGIMLDNVGGDFTILKSQFEGVQIQIYEKLVPALRGGMKQLSKALGSVDWDSFGSKAGSALNGIIKVLAGLVKHGDAAVKVLKLLIAAFAISKINKYANAIKTTTAFTSVMTGVTRNATIAQNAQTVATNLGTTATKGLWAVMKANPIGFVITGVTLLVEGFKLLIDHYKETTKETDENILATQKLAKEQDKLNKSITENSKARSEAIQSAEEETATADVLFRKLEELNGIENKSTSQKKEMKSIVAQLNAIMPDLNLKYDEEADSLNKSTDAIKQNIEAQKDLMLAKAAQEQMEGVAKDIAKAEMEEAKLTEQRVKNEQAYQKAKKATADFQASHGDDPTKYSRSELAEYKKLLAAEDKKYEAVNKAKDAVEKEHKVVEKLNKEYNKIGDYATGKLDDAEIAKGLSAITEKAKKAGEEIPQAVSDGITEGKYAIPDSIDELKKLIQLDSAIEKAGLAGEDIPASISQGVIKGKTSIKEAIGQINEVVDFQGAFENANVKSAAMPQNIAKNLKDGKITVDEANKELNQAIKFDEALQKASKDGTAIPEKLAENVRNGKISVAEATKELNAATSFGDMITKAGLEGSDMVKALSSGIKDGSILPSQALEEVKIIADGKYDELVQKANEKGIEVPTTIAQGIEKGVTLPSEAVARMNALIKYQDALDKAKIDGANVPKYFADGIAKGDIKVSDANAEMNRLIKFQAALEKAGIGGTEIPSVLAKNIATGKTKVAQATTQMNNWIKFQTALENAGMSGKKIPEKLQQAILSGKKKPSDAVNELIKAMAKTGGNTASMEKAGQSQGSKFANGTASKKNEASKAGSEVGDAVVKGADKKQEMENTGSNLGSGLINGIKGWIKKAWNWGANLASQAVKGAESKKGADTHSPSKKTTRIGKWIGEGLSKGMASQTKKVNKAATTLAQSAIASLKKANNKGNYSEIGKNLIDSFTKTINAKVKTATDSVSDLVTKYYNTLTNNSTKNQKALQNKINKVDKQIAKTKNKNTKKALQKQKKAYQAELKAMKSSNSDLAKAAKSAGTTISKAYATAIKNGANKAIKAATDSITKLTDKYQAAYDDITNKQANFLKALENNGSLYIENEDGSLYLGTLQESAKEITTLGKKLEKLKASMPEGLLQDIVEMDVQTANKFTDAFLSMSKTEQQAYIKAYNEREKAAQNVSTKFYASQLATLKKNFNNEVTKEMAKLESKLKTIGQNAVSGMITGMNSKKKALAGASKTMANTIVKALKKELKIKSPSKVMASVSKWIPEGVAVGINDNVKTVIDSVKNMADKAVEASQSLIGGMEIPMLATPTGAVGDTTNNNQTSTVVNNNFNQTINAPKQPSRIELYRQTKNLLNLKGGSI